MLDNPDFPRPEIIAVDNWDEKFCAELKVRFGDQALKHFPEELLRLKNIETKFSGDLSHRPELRSQGGIIFANHPRGAVEAGIVLQAIQDEKGNIRPDLKILVLESKFSMYANNFGQQSFVAATRDSSKVGGVFNEIADHINGGGAFLIFPERWQGVTTSGVRDFENGLAYLFAKVNPDKMVYSFSINPQDVNERQEERGEQGTNVVRVYENYSTAQEWQRLMAVVGGNRSDQSRKLKDHYFQIHQENL